MPVSSYNLAPGQSAEDLAIKRKIALALMQQGSSAEPIQHWAQGLARLGQSAIGGYELYQADKADKEERAKGNEMIAKVLGGAAPTAAPASAPAGNYGEAIAGIESGGKYDALGPVTKSGDRAYGKYQVMGANIPEWTRTHLGQEMTPDQFLANPQAQDAVFKGQFGQYAGKYGPEGAARAWFAGEGGMNDLGRKDQLGTTVGQYGQKFAQALGPQGAQAPAPNNQAIIQLLGNRYTAPIAQQIASGVISQQFKPAEYDFKPRDDGSIVAINKKNPQDMRIVQPGDPNALIQFGAKKKAAETQAELQAKQAAAKEAARPGEVKQAGIVVQDIDRAISLIDKSPLTTTGTVGPLLSRIGGTAANDVRALLDTVKANAGFDELQKMRNNSPTGGALGQVSELEIAYLQATIGNLEQSQTPEQFKDNLRRVKNAYLDVIHGQGKGPPREKLTFEQKSSAPIPTPGMVEQGYRFKGGDPSKPENWEQVM